MFCFMLAAEDGERSQDQQGLQEGQAHAGVLQDAMFRWEPSVACRNTRTAPALCTAVKQTLRPMTSLPAHKRQATLLAACHCSHDTRLRCSPLELALSLACRRTQEAMNLWQVLGQKAATPSTVLPPGIPAEQQEALRQSMCLKAAEAATELRALSMRQAGQQQGPGQQVGGLAQSSACLLCCQQLAVLAVWMHILPASTSRG